MLGYANPTYDLRRAQAKASGRVVRRLLQLERSDNGKPAAAHLRRFQKRKGMEAAGIEPASESSPLKASTMRSSYFNLIFRTPTSGMPSDQPKRCFGPAPFGAMQPLSRIVSP